MLCSPARPPGGGIGRNATTAATNAGGGSTITTAPRVLGIESPITMLGRTTPAPALMAPMILGTRPAQPAATNARAASLRPPIASPAMGIIEEEPPTAHAIMAISMLDHPIAKLATTNAQPVFPIQPIARAAMGIIEDQPPAAHASLAITM